MEKSSTLWVDAFPRHEVLKSREIKLSTSEVSTSKWVRKQASKQVSEQASMQASKQACKRASKRAEHKQASKRASKQEQASKLSTSKHASKRVSKQVSKQVHMHSCLSALGCGCEVARMCVQIRKQLCGVILSYHHVDPGIKLSSHSLYSKHLWVISLNLSVLCILDDYFP